MTVPCPYCASKLSWWTLRASFRCPSCHKALKARITGPWITTLVAWSFADFFLRLVFPLPAGPSASELFVVRSMISLGIGCLIASSVIGTYSKVSKGDPGASPS